MKFLFKIWSNYNGFAPSELPNRTLPGGRLRLRWSHYIESVEEEESEIWVYFHGRHAFENGVYVKGIADEVDIQRNTVVLRIREQSTTRPLTDAATSTRIAAAVAARGRQVFLLPEYLRVAPECSLSSDAETCKARQCGSCRTWQAFPRVHPHSLHRPENLDDGIADFVPAYWVVAPRNFLYQEGRRIKSSVRQTSELFLRFKTGDENLAYPLALGIREALAERELNEFDAVIHVPLSPDKMARGEIHRTELLAYELARLLGTRHLDALSLSQPTSKRVLQGKRGYSPAQFEWAYRRRLQVRGGVRRYERILLVDDVCTKGNTLSACAAALHSANPDLEVVAATAGQMTVKRVVRRVSDIAA